MRKFHLAVDLESSNVLSAFGFGSDFHREGTSRLAARTKFETPACTFFLWGRFYSFDDERCLRDWLHCFNPTDIPAWLAAADGDFLIFVLDRNARRVHLITDRNGQYRTYVYFDNSRLVLANSLFDMVRLMGGARLSSFGIYQLLTIKFNMDPYCVLDQVWVTSMGQVQTFAVGSRQVITYYRPVDFDTGYLKTVADCVAALGESLEKVLRKRLSEKGRPVLLLSGGIDSTALLVYLSRIAPGEVHTLTYAPRGLAENELADARVTAQHLRSHHHELILDSSRYVDLFVESVLDADTPYYGAMVMRAVKQALEADNSPWEVFGGIDTRLHTPPVDTTREIGRWINLHFASPKLAREFSLGRQWPDYFLKRLLPRASYAEFMLKLFLGYNPHPSLLDVSDEHFQKLLAELPDFRSDRTRDETFKNCVSFSYKCQYTDDMNYHVSAMESDALSVHIPFCDHEFVRACNRVPYRIGSRDVFTLKSGRRFVPFVDKWVMRQWLKDAVPPEVLYRRKAAPDELHMFFADRSFRHLMDGVLARWFAPLLDVCDPVVRAILSDTVERYSRLQEFSASNVFLLRCVYLAVYLALVNQVCLDPAFDLDAALLEVKSQGRALAKTSTSAGENRQRKIADKL